MANQGVGRAVSKRQTVKRTASDRQGKKTNFDMPFFLLIVTLLVFGLVMMFSASAPSASYKYGDSYKFLKSQAMWSGLGILAMIVMTNFDYRKLKKLSPMIMLGALVLLVAVLIPGIGKSLNGARRWLNIPGVSLQPSELMKIAVIIFFAAKLSEEKEENLRKFKTGLMPYLILLGIIAVLMMLEPHFSGTIVILGVGVIMLLVAGVNIWHFVGLGSLGIPVVAYVIIKEPYRLKRIVSFLDPMSNKLDGGWQIVQSLYAIGSGGIFGLGLGLSRQKFLYIPEPQNDFIFAIVCEELGLIGAVIVMALFICLIWRGIKIALEAADAFGCLLTVGIIALIAVQMLINIAVVTSSVPVTGMPLPFFSAGGTSMTVLLAALGIVLNVSKYKKG